ncbi:MAG: hypothetical protein ACE5IL_12425 [Myxococcota bacterium]
MKLSHVEGAILAGTQAGARGLDEAGVGGQGTSPLERVATWLDGALERVRIVLPREASNPTTLARIDPASRTRDALAGVEAALCACEVSAVLVAAPEVPELDSRLLFALLGLVPTEGGADIVVPLTPRGPEPRLAVYRPRILPEVRRRIAARDFSLHGLLDAVQTQPVPWDLLRPLDPELRSLREEPRSRSRPLEDEDPGG